MAGTTVNQFKKLFPASTTHSKLSAGKVPLKLKLKNFWGDETLDDLTKLVSLFGVSGQYLHLSKVDDGCIAALWLCSLYDAKELKINVFEAADSLQAKGVLQVFVGKEFLLECSHSKPGAIYININFLKVIIMHMLPVVIDTVLSAHSNSMTMLSFCDLMIRKVDYIQARFLSVSIYKPTR